MNDRSCFSPVEPAVWIDEKPVVLHQDVRPPLPMRPSRIARRDCECKRFGTANALCVVQPKGVLHSIRAAPSGR
jgi:hypothetical protein